MTEQLSAEYWNNRYVNNDFGWDVGTISEPLKHYFDQIADKSLSILIPGAGNAHEAEYLINKGFTNVSVCDLAPEPLKKLQQRCPQMMPENLILGDFFELEGNTFDLIIEQTFFCAIDRRLRQKYFQKMHALLAPQGKLVGLLFNDTMNNDQPPFGGSAEEYKNYFQTLFRVKTYEACYNSIKPRANRELFIHLIKA
ncbi:MAG: methyltransferase domain-containing protein [Bacteroidota bacterium]